MTHQIVLREWHYDCGDRCCYEYGTELYFDGQLLTRHSNATAEELQLIFEALKMPVTVSVEFQNDEPYLDEFYDNDFQEDDHDDEPDHDSAS